MLEQKFDWDDANITHIALHSVKPAEAESAILNDPFDLNVQFHGDEERALQIGSTTAGRILVVVSIVRNGRIRVVTAFPAERWQKILFLRERGIKADDQG